MNIRHIAIAAASLLLCAGAATAADYTSVVLEKTVDRPADAVWKKIGDYCALKDWMKVSCEYTSGKGDLGTVRTVAGKFIEVMVGKTPLSYTYAFPSGEEFYHGTLAVVADGPQRSKIVYSVFYNQEPLATAEAKAADRDRYTKTFGGALDTMKAMAEAK